VRQVPVTAPISGTVGKINLSIGTYTDASSPIMEIVNNNNMHCDLRVFEKDIISVKIGQPVRFTVAGSGNKQVSGKVFGINKSIDPENKSVIIHAVVNNVASLNLLEGMYVSALIETGKNMVSVVPKDAIVKVVDKSYIFVLEGTEKEKVAKDADDKTVNKNDSVVNYRFKMMEVVPGIEELGYVQISLIEPLEANAKIVTKGAFYIWSGMQSTEADEL
jgi:cobalt-zinc-cadmium efflux system membrane fusion protein